MPRQIPSNKPELDTKQSKNSVEFDDPYLNMMMPPMKVTHRAAPKAVEKQRRCASLAADVMAEE